VVFITFECEIYYDQLGANLWFRNKIANPINHPNTVRSVIEVSNVTRGKKL